MTTNPPLVPELLLEQLALGELDAATAADVRARLAAEPGGLARLDALAADTAAVLTAHPPTEMARMIRARASMVAPPVQSRARWTRWWPAIPTLAAAAIALMVIQPWAPSVDGSVGPIGPDGAADTMDGVRTKGVSAPSLALFRQTADGAELLPPESPAGPGDRLLVHYSAAKQRYGMVLSIDGNGVVTQHLPLPSSDSSDAATLSPDPATPLPTAYELDAAPAFERFFLVTRAEPFSIDAVHAAAEALAADPIQARVGALALPDDMDMQQTSTLVVKTSAPRKQVTP